MERRLDKGGMMKKKDIVSELKKALTRAEQGKQNNGNYGIAYAYGSLTQSIKTMILMLESREIKGE